MLAADCKAYFNEGMSEFDLSVIKPLKDFDPGRLLVKQQLARRALDVGRWEPLPSFPADWEHLTESEKLAFRTPYMMFAHTAAGAIEKAEEKMDGISPATLETASAVMVHHATASAAESFDGNVSHDNIKSDVMSLYELLSDPSLVIADPDLLSLGPDF